MIPWNQPESDPLSDLQAMIKTIKEADEYMRIGSFGTRRGDIVLTKAMIDAMWKQDQAQFQEMTGHTLESFEQEAKDNSMVEFGNYRAMISYPMEDNK